MEVMNKKTQEAAPKSKEKNKQEAQPKGKAGQEYNKNKVSQKQVNTEQETNGPDKSKQDTKKAVFWDFEDDFSEMEPPVIEPEKNNQN